MRVVITGGTLTVILFLIIIIHGTMICMNVREQEIRTNLEDCADYAIDKLQEAYEEEMNTGIHSLAKEEQDKLLFEFMSVFCDSLNKRLYTDGEVTVTLIESSLSLGTFDIVIRETFEYRFMKKVGSCTYERAFCLTENKRLP
jgi:hypothetical protein